MKKFLFTTLPSNDLGLLTRSLPIARELKERGHRITFCSPAIAPGKLISAAGFDNLLPRWAVYSILTGNTGLINYCRLLRSGHLWRDAGILARYVKHIRNSVSAEVWNIDHFMYMMGMQDEIYVRAAVEALAGMINEYRPDVIVDFWNPLVGIAARICRVPLVSVIQADMHPLSKGFIWWKPHPAGLPTTLPSINTVLAEHSLAPAGRAGELLVGDMTLVVGMPETDPLPDGADVTYIGPLLWQKQNEKLPEWIDGLRTDLPVIWLYAGNLRYMSGSETPYDSLVIVKACIEALKDMPVQVVLSSGHQLLPDDLLPLPANFHHAAFIPGLAMAERSDLMIHHGGYGSCQTGLFTGTPAVIIPTFSERESNARRVAAAGAGEFILPAADASGRKKEVNIDILRLKVDKVLSSASYREQAGKISRRMKRFGGAPAAASLIEDYALQRY